MKANRRSHSAFLIAGSLLLIPALAEAHPGHSGAGFTHGFAHPLGGADHLLAMVAVGLWAAQLGRRAPGRFPPRF